ncbi:2-dehydro-3-deoxygalactonokinase [Salibaculum griseiflavum]|uniref:2-keto-3-deoxy-galactonokinase n=1 Tax=Salibaculum griseiflavum TaxID=1914409 RepID=A0A2V1P5K8_9RHOB|nr:2-dehydro-3-deoxygalactonokinase [Salibaculum griseiflavum]PWG17783.1 2-keto-3-deoxy-galactonokinase [Salibaculum griseiflavum]
MTPDWLAVDWGTSHLRVWLMGPDGAVLDQRRSDRGMGHLSRDQFEPALLALVGDALPDGGTVPVIVCGMAGSRQGWAEAPYATVPCAPPSIGAAVAVTTADPRLSVFIVPGIKQVSPPDVMRGEETQIAGFLVDDPGFDGVLCLPGTHCKWVHISAGEVVSFRTFMTGELFALLEQASVLRHSVKGGDWEADAFASAVEDAMSRPATVAAELFSIRAAALLEGVGPGPSRARLSGLLIGLELAGARPYWLGQDIRVVGAGGIAAAYHDALAAQGASVATVTGDGMALRGLRTAYETLREAAQ